MLSIQSVLYELPIRIYEVQYGISVLLIRSCESDDLEVLIGLLEALVKMGPDVDACVGVVTIIVERDADHHVGLLVLWVTLIQTVDHCLVNVKY
jgi:hypothetical protein